MQLFEQVINSSIFGVFIYQQKGEIVFANRRFANILGFESPDEIIGKSILEFVQHSDKTYISNIIQRRTLGEEFDIELELHHFIGKNNTVIPVSVFAYTIDYNNSPAGFVMIIDKSKVYAYEKLFYALSQINQLIVRAENEQELLKEAVLVLVEKAGYVACAAGYIKDGLFVQLYTKANTKEHEEALKALTIGIDPDTAYGRGTVSKAFHTKKVGPIENIDKLESASYWHSYYKAFNIHSACAIPILKKGKIAYIILILDSMHSFDKDHLNLLDEIQLDLSFALERLENEKFNRITLQALNSGFEFVIITDKDFNIVFANENALKTSGYSKEELLGKHHSIFSSKRHTKSFVKSFYNTLTLGKSYTGAMQYKTKDETIKNFFVNISPFIEQGAITHYIAIGKEFQNQDELLNQLEYLINYDNLTKLQNLHAFKQSIERHLVRIKQKNYLSALLVINPVNFKEINRAYGLEFGDKVLITIAQRLESTLKNYDIAAKLESDKFGVLLKDFTNEEDILAASLKLLNTLKEPYTIEEEAVFISFNIGLSVAPQDGTTPESLLNEANVALFDARQKGENTIGFFKEELKQAAQNELKLKSELEQAIANKNFIAYYQPYIDKDKKIIGAEALLRWTKNGQVVSPLEFIEYLESTDLIINAEEIIFSQVLSDLKELSSLNIDISLSINLSDKSLKQKSIGSYIISSLNYYKLKGSNFRIEILERTLIENFEYMNSLMTSLKKHSIGFALDDFGTGYSSLSYLANLPIKYLKIDISFVRKMLSDDKTKFTIEAIILIAKKLDIETIAEGVETIDQFEALKKAGCDYFQGYLFYKPMPREEFLEIVKENSAKK